jgi:nitrate reductase (NAD(P)H)
VNIKREQDEKKSETNGEMPASKDGAASQAEHEWRRPGDKEKHHDAYASEQPKQNSKGASDSKKNNLSDKYTAQELALLRALEHEKDYVYSLRENDGQQKSPQVAKQTEITIDEQDQFSPDNWVPRSSHLIRLTGKHPLNAEPQLDHLFDAGLVTPNELHYVRNHGLVPRLLWEFHKVDIEYNGRVKTISMEDISSHACINIPVLLACDGNRRKELNMIKKSKGFNWGPGGLSCAYWKGPLVRDVLLSVGVPDSLPSGKRYWLNFEGAEELSDGKYATCIPFEYAMDPQNDVILAYEMNDVPLPPDHGYPVRLIIPGYVGGRCVKWLRRIWISHEENDSHYHIWDNRVLPSFVTEKDGPFAEALFRHPDTACNEQNLNSVIVKPAQGETIPVSRAKKGDSYRIEGFAYDGGGHQVQRVEVSLDNGKSWLYCIRRFPDNPIRHGKKFWAWVHWHIDVEISHMLRADSITVRCFNVFKNTQPRDANWNIMGMMNNCWYVVRPEIIFTEDSNEASILFRHPTEPGTGEGGWMKPSVENTIAKVRQEAGAPQKEFTREEIEKHDKRDDCWIVVDGKVYDATSVLDWHPGGPAAILGHAGKVHQETSDEFSSIHDDYAYQKLKGMSRFNKVYSICY